MTKLNPIEKISLIKQLRAECYNCSLCALSNNRPPIADVKRPQVFSSGHVGANIMLVGQNPGLTEVKEGKPFVGSAGRVLDKALVSAGIDRKLLYITNSVLCYTTNNDVPPDYAVEACKKYLIGQIDILQPDVIVVMGKSASRSFGFGNIFNVKMCESPNSHTTPLHNNVYFTVHPAYTLYSKTGFEILVNTFTTIKPFLKEK